MAGIRSFGAYIPKYRLGKDTAGWGLSQEKAIANFDEDSITMAVAAGMDCLRGIESSLVEAVYFATTTPPYLEKQGAAIIAAALDLRQDIFTADITSVLRAGTIAMKSAMDAINSGSARQVLVVAADTRTATPRSDMERNLGDGAAAFLLSTDGEMATLEGATTLSEHMLDVWRPQGEQFLRSWEERFVVEEGYQRVLPNAFASFMKKNGGTPRDFAKVVMYAPDGRRHVEMGKRLGFSDKQLQDPLFGKVGNTGAAFPLMLLASALEEAKPGDLILTISYGDGSDVQAWRAGPGAGKIKVSGVKRQVESKSVLPNYETYARWRGAMTTDAARRPQSTPSVTALWRETEQNIRFYGARCKSCGCLQYPPQLVCVRCQASDFEKERIADKRGEVFTYSLDYLAGTVDIPLVVAVVNLQGGGRLLTTVTDREVEQVKVGMPVEFSFRKLFTAAGIHNYYWKAVPIRAA